MAAIYGENRKPSLIATAAMIERLWPSISCPCAPSAHTTVGEGRKLVEKGRGGKNLYVAAGPQALLCLSVGHFSPKNAPNDPPSGAVFTVRAARPPDDQHKSPRLLWGRVIRIFRDSARSRERRTINERERRGARRNFSRPGEKSVHARRAERREGKEKSRGLCRRATPSFSS